MTDQSHPSVLAVHEAANAVVSHVHEAPSGSFWRHWFEAPHEPHLADEVRAFVKALKLVLDVPPTMLTRSDLAGIGSDVERVVKRIEAAIDEPGKSGADASGSLAPAIYVIRARYEELYKRGARKQE